jgi:hypothetical protein
MIVSRGCCNVKPFSRNHVGKREERRRISKIRIIKTPLAAGCENGGVDFAMGLCPYIRTNVKKVSPTPVATKSSVQEALDRPQRFFSPSIVKKKKRYRAYLRIS